MNPVSPNPGERKPVVNIVTVVRQSADYLQPLIRQLDSLSERACTIGRICVVHDAVPQGLTPAIAQWSAASGGRVVPVQEAQSDERIEDLDAKARQWASIGNQGIEAATRHEADFVLWVEGDLCFPSDLLDQLVARDLDVVAPLIYLGGVFYDSWGFRDLSGRKLFAFPVREFPAQPVELSSVGSCVLFRSAILRAGVRFRGTYADGLLVGMCRDARQLGYRVWADPSVCIVHPTTHWRAQVWQVLQAVVFERSGEGRSVEFARTHVPGFYAEFIMEFLQQDRQVGALLGAGVYDLTVIRNPRDRTLRLGFEAVEAPPGTPADARLIRDIVQVVEPC